MHYSVEKLYFSPSEELAMANSPSGRTPRSLLPPISPLGSAVVGAPMEAAFVSRTWSIASPDRRARRHAFLTLRGQARFQHAGEQADIELKAPFILWLPRSLLGEFRLEAGGEGVALSILDDFVLSAIGEQRGRGAPATASRPDRGSDIRADRASPRRNRNVLCGARAGIARSASWRSRHDEPASRRHSVAPLARVRT